jgi:hypothetical protein
MNPISRKCRRSASGLAVFAAALLLWPAGLSAQENASERMSTVGDHYTFEALLPEMSTASLRSARDLAEWCMSMAKSFKDRTFETLRQIDLQREAKRAEIKALEAREKGAGKAKDAALKKEMQGAVRQQKLELDILDAVKGMTAQESAIAGELEAAGRELEGLVEGFRDLAQGRRDALNAYEQAVRTAAEAGLAAPAPPAIDTALNERALKALGEVGKDIKAIGDRFEKIAKERQGLLKAWQKMMQPAPAK